MLSAATRPGPGIFTLGNSRGVGTCSSGHRPCPPTAFRWTKSCSPAFFLFLHSLARFLHPNPLPPSVIRSLSLPSSPLLPQAPSLPLILCSSHLPPFPWPSLSYSLTLPPLLTSSLPRLSLRPPPLRLPVRLNPAAARRHRPRSSASRLHCPPPPRLP